MTPENARILAKNALAAKDLWTFCRLMYPQFFLPEREYLREMCEKIQNFAENSPKQFLIVNAPPRHGKSLTAQALTAWLFGQNPKYKVMTGSYNERLSGIFARTVRNLIQTEKIGENVVYADIFPGTKVKYGEASAAMWSLEGSNQVSYLATSPNATATGFGADFLVIDDIIKSAEEAYNQNVLENHWSWFVNTMLSRLEGKRKVIVIMTRWAENDLAGKIAAAFADETEIITYRAKNGEKMLDETILSAEDYELLTQEMNLDIVEANYNQKPIDVGGRLYAEFKTWENFPIGEIKNYTDTADTGTDFLCSVNYVEFEKEAYILDLVFSDKPQEITENLVAELFAKDHVNFAEIESNNGGRGFARNISRILRENYSTNKTVISAVAQTKNKESRILTSSAWVQNHVYMPPNWRTRWPEFYKQIMNYQRKGKNAHDDAVDVLASIYEKVAGENRRICFLDEAPNNERKIFTY